MQRSQREVTFALALSSLLVVSMVAPVGAVDARSGALAQSNHGLLDDPLSFLDDPDAVETEAGGANFTVSNLHLPSPAGPNQTIGIEATVTNAGNETANQTVGYHFEGETLWSTELRIEDGEAVDVLPAAPDHDPDRDYVVANATLPADLANETYTHGVYTPQDASNATVDVRTDSAVLEGRVYPSDDLANRVAGANVTLEAALADDGTVRSLQETTDQNGSFAFDYAPAPANYTITVEREGYAASTVSMAETLSGLAPVPVGYRVQQPVALAPLGSIEGTVTDDSNDPVADANVTLVDAGGTVTNATITGEDGSYGFAGVEPGEYVVTANASGHGEDWTNATVTAGETETADVALEGETGRLSFNPKNSNGNTIDDATIYVSQNGTVIESVTIGPFGGYSVEVPTGENYTVRTTAPDYYDATRTNVTVPGNGTVPVLTLDLQRVPGTVTGVVTENASGDAISTATVRLDGDFEVRDVEVDADGSYAVENVTPGDYTVTSDAEGYLENQTTVTVEANESRRLPFSLDRETGTVEGTVTNDETGEPVANATVTLYDGDREWSEATDVDGTYAFDSAPTGEYTVFANASGYATNNTTVVEVDGDAPTTHDLGLDPLAVTVSVADFTAPDETRAGVIVTVLANVTNEGDRTANRTVRYEFAGETVDAPAFELAPGETRREPFYYALPDDLAPGTYSHGVYTGDDSVTTQIDVFEPANLTVGQLQTTAPVDGGDVVNVTTTLQNAGSVAASETVTLTVDGTTIADSELVDVQAGAQRTVTLGWNTSTDDVGDYELTVATGNASRSTGVDVRRATGTLAVDATGPDGTAVANATIDVFEDGEEVANATTGPTGGSQLDVPVGDDYAVRVGAPGYRTATLTDVGIQTDETTALNVTLRRWNGSVSGVVETEDGDALADATVRLVGEDETQSVDADVDGSYSFPAVTPGNYTLVANASKYVTVERNVTVVANQTVAADVALERETGRLSFNPKNPNGNTNNDATIYVSQNGTVIESTTIGPFGGYAVEVPTGDDYAVRITAPDYYDATRTNVTVPGNETVPVLTLDLQPLPGTVSGVVTSEATGEVIDTATVALESVDGDYATTADVDADGNYAFENVSTGVYNLAAGAPGYIIGETIVDVGANSTVEADFDLDRKTGAVSGIVTESNGDGINNATVSIDHERVGAVQTDENGSFTIESVPTGEYDVSVTKLGYTSNTSASVAVEANETTTVDVSLTVDTVPISVENLETVDSAEQYETIEVSATIKREGTNSESKSVRYRFDGQPREWTEVTLPPGVSRSVTFEFEIPGDVDLGNTTHGVFTSRGSATETIEVLEPHGAIEGTVVSNGSGTAVPDANVTLRDGDGAVVNETHTDDGTFSFDAIPLAEYELVAAAPNYDAGNRTVEVGPDGPNSGNVSLDPVPGSLSGTVTDENGTPVAGATVELGDDVGATETADDGSFVLDAVPAEVNHELSVTAPGYATERQTVSVPAAGSASEAVSLPEASVSVDSLDAPGSSVRGEELTVSATVTNRGDVGPNTTVSFWAGATEVDDETVAFDGTGDTATVEFTYTPGGAGTAEFAVRTVDDRRGTEITIENATDDHSEDDSSDDDDGGGISFGPPAGSSGADVSVLSAEASESSILAGSTVRVDVTVQNQGDARGSIDVELTADGQLVDSETVSVPGGSNVGTTLSGSIDEPGTYELAVAGESAGTLQVESTEDDEESGGATDDSGSEVEEGSDGNSSVDGQPGFGLVAAVVALLVGTLFARRRS